MKLESHAFAFWGTFHDDISFLREWVENEVRTSMPTQVLEEVAARVGIPVAHAAARYYQDYLS